MVYGHYNNIGSEFKNILYGADHIRVMHAVIQQKRNTNFDMTIESVFDFEAGACIWQIINGVLKWMSRYFVIKLT